MANQASTVATRCPLCQRANQCAVAAGDDASQCWCVGEKFPQPLLDDLQQRGAQWCLCSECLEKAQGVNHAG